MDILGILDVPVLWIVIFMVLLLAYIYNTWTFNILKDAGISHPMPIPVLGNMHYLMIHGLRNIDLHLSKQFGKVFGFYEGRQPSIVVLDCDMLKEIMVKEFSSFTNRRFVALPPQIIKKALPNTKDEHWRLVRSYITPTFSSGKMRKMSPLIIEAANQMVESLEIAHRNKQEIDLKQLCGNFTMEAVASTAFGIQLNAQKEKNHPFVSHAKQFFQFGVTDLLFLIPAFFPFLTPILNALHFEIGNKATIRFFTKTVQDTLCERKENPQNRPDLLKLMVDAEHDFTHSHDVGNNNISNGAKVTKKKGLSTEDVTAQSIVFLLAGYETTATTLTFLLYNLAVYPECQKKVIKEINKVLVNGEEPDYDSVVKLPYLDQCIDETLRLYPPAPRVNRVASRDVVINGFKFPKGVVVTIPIKALHSDPQVWANPDQFDPDRFSPEAKAGRHPYNFMPFGSGPRTCVGMRLAELELKMAAAKALRNFKFLRTPSTEVPLTFVKQTVITRTKNPIILGLEKRV